MVKDLFYVKTRTLFSLGKLEMMKQLKLNIEDEENIVESRLILSKRLENHPIARVIKEHPECLYHHGNCFLR